MKTNNDNQTVHPAYSVSITTETHAKMRIHVAKLGLKIKVWVDRVLNNAMKKGE